MPEAVVWVLGAALLCPVLGASAQAQARDGAEDRHASARTDTITANGVPIVYEILGEGEPLVLVHGWAMHRGYWDGTAELLARDHRVIRYDRRGYGESGGRPDPTADPADLTALLDSLGIRRAHVIGHSGGNRTARDFAARFPDRIGGLVLYGAGPPADFQPARQGMDEYFGEMARLARSDGIGAVREAVLEMAEREFGGPRTPEIRERARRLIQAWQGWELLDPAPPSGMVDPVGAGELHLVGAPTLVILGEDEGAYFHLAADAYAYGIPDARKVVVPGGGHSVDWVEPERFAAEIVGFLRRNAPRIGAR